MTIHKAQGATVRRAFLLTDDAMANEQLYTALSRARARTDLFVDVRDAAEYEVHAPIASLSTQERLRNIARRSARQSLAIDADGARRGAGVGGSSRSWCTACVGRTRVVGSIVVLSLCVVACTDRSPSASRPASTTASTSPPASSGSNSSFSPTGPPLSQSLGEPSCADGRSVVPILGPRMTFGVIVRGATLANGHVLIVVSNGSDSVVVYAFEALCNLDSTFGDRGKAVLHFDSPWVDIWDVEPTLQGGALLVGEAGADAVTTRWLVARIDSHGAFDSTFSDDGSEVLPWQTEAASVVETAAGNILVGGEDAEGGCCVRTYVAELDGSGRIVDSYGSDGRTEVQDPFVDSGIEEVAVIDGVTIAVVSGGNMGCWGTSVSALDAEGHPVPSFQDNFDAARAQVAPSSFEPGVFVSAFVARESSFDLVGTTQNNCVDDKRDPTETGLIARFELDGRLAATFGDHGALRFDLPMASRIWTTVRSTGSILVATGADTYMRSDDKELDFFVVDPDGMPIESVQNPSVQRLQLADSPHNVFAYGDEAIALAVSDSEIEITAVFG
jgi:hypothetical protein